MGQIRYREAELYNLKYIKLTYTDLDNNINEIRTEYDFLGDQILSVFFKTEEDFNIKYPQEVALKFITDEAVYITKTTLYEIKRAKDKLVYLTLATPTLMDYQQNRKFFRIKIDRVCVLVATDKEGNSTTFMSRIIDLSAGGVLLHQIETMFTDDFITIDTSKYVKYNIVLILGINTVLKLNARYVRQDKSDVSQRYAFEFIDNDEKNINTISKFVTQEQVSDLKFKNKYNK